MTLSATFTLSTHCGIEVALHNPQQQWHTDLLIDAQPDKYLGHKR